MTRGVYVVNFNGAVTAAKTLLQVKAGAASALEILRATVTNESSETSEAGAIHLLRKTVAATVTAFTPLPLNPLDAAQAVGGAAATGHTATAEGTDGAILLREAFNILSGWQYLPVPEERIIVPAGGIVALKSAVAVASVTLNAQIIFREMG